MKAVYDTNTVFAVANRSDSQTAAIRRAGFLLFMLSLVAFQLSPVWVLSDSNYSMLLSESIIHRHSNHLNGYTFPAPIREDAHCISMTPNAPEDIQEYKNISYQLDKINGSINYCYPHGTSILSIPFVAIMNGLGVNAANPDGSANPTGEAAMQRLLASILMASLTLLIFRTALILLSVMPSALIALGAAFGTQMWSTASRAMWQHTWLILLGSFVVFLLLKQETTAATPRPILLATLLAWMYFIRPTAAIPILCVTVYLASYYRREFIVYAVTGAAWFAGFVLYSWITFGRLIPDYYIDSRSSISGIVTGLPAILFSPSRGLFIYVPIYAFVLYLVVRYWASLPSRRLAVLALSIVAIQIVMVAMWPVWWGGFCYGPRLLTDTIPWMVLLGILGVSAWLKNPSAEKLNNLEIAVMVVLLLWSVAINARGAISPATRRWSLEVNIDRYPERAWDWSYPQFMAGLISPPKYR